MGADELDPKQVAAFFRQDDDTDAYYDISAIPHDWPPLDALRLVVQMCELAPDDLAVSWIGVALLEPLIQSHWQAIGEPLARAAQDNARLRGALRAAVYDLPRRARDLDRRLQELADRGGE